MTRVCWIPRTWSRRSRGTQEAEITEDETAFALMFLRNMDEKLDRFFEETRDLNLA
jgi:hypothetical protein